MLKRFEKFSYLISELSRLIHKIEADELEPLGLKGPYAIYILTLNQYSEGITLSKLSELCAKDKADASRAINALTEKGYTERILPDGDEDDKSQAKLKYRAPIRLTPSGEAIARKLVSRARLAVEFASNGLSDDNRRIFYDSLEIIYSNMKSMSMIGVPEEND